MVKYIINKRQKTTSSHSSSSIINRLHRKRHLVSVKQCEWRTTDNWWGEWNDASRHYLLVVAMTPVPAISWPRPFPVTLGQLSRLLIGRPRRGARPVSFLQFPFQPVNQSCIIINFNLREHKTMLIRSLTIHAQVLLTRTLSTKPPGIMENVNNRERIDTRRVTWLLD